MHSDLRLDTVEKIDLKVTILVAQRNNIVAEYTRRIECETSVPKVMALMDKLSKRVYPYDIRLDSLENRRNKLLHL
jgi:hypothetical protein